MAKKTAPAPPQNPPPAKVGRKIISFFSRKGGQGKTTLASHYAKFNAVPFVTNDNGSGTSETLADKFLPGFFHFVGPGQDVIDLPSLEFVFDFGGFDDPRRDAILRGSNLVVVPLSFQGPHDIRGFYSTINIVAPLNQNIIITINNTEPALIPDVLTGISDTYADKYPVFVVPRSRFLWRLGFSGQDINNIQETGLHAAQIAKVQAALRALWTAIDHHPAVTL